MQPDRNIIFLYPLTAKLQELKDELEEDERALVYEIDSVTEYSQLIGIIDYSVTFSSDSKKTQSYLLDTKKIIKNKNSKNFLMQSEMIPPAKFTKLQNLGLNEIVQEMATVKSILHKLNIFFSPIEAKAKKDEENKNKAIMEMGGLSDSSLDGDSSQKEENSNEKLRIEKMAIMEEEEEFSGKAKTNKAAAALMFGEEESENVQVKDQDSADLSNSSFDDLKRKEVADFKEVERESKLKKGITFEEAELEKGDASSQGKEDDIGELNKKKASTFEDVLAEAKESKKLDLDFGEEEMKRKKTLFDEVERDLEKEKSNFKEVEIDSENKRGAFDEALNELERKKAELFKDTQAQGREKENFDESLKEYERKKLKLDEFENDINEKTADIDSLDEDLKKKRSSLDDEEMGPSSKLKLLDALADLQRKKSEALEELDRIGRKKNAFLSELIEEVELKKLEKQDEGDDKLRPRFEEEALEPEEKTRSHFPSENPKNKKNANSEAETDSDAKGEKLELPVTDEKKKGASLDEASLEKKKNKALDLETAQNIRKAISFEEVEIERDRLRTLERLGKERALVDFEEVDFTDNKIKQDDVILDYRKLKKQYKEGKLSEKDEERQGEKRKKTVEEILEIPEYTFFENQSYGVEYLVLHHNFLLQKEILSESLFKFIHFALIKEYDGDISFYIANPGAKENASLSSNICLYSGHKTRKNKILDNDYDEFESRNIEAWMNEKLPIWKDETYQVELNEFIYPYFEEGSFLGISISHFRGTVNSHADAQKVELLSMSLKGSIFYESLKNNGM